jgi:hypothetical protein
MKPRTLQVLATAALVASLGWSLVGRKPAVPPAAATGPAESAKPAAKVRSSANLKLPGWSGPADKGPHAVLRAMEAGQKIDLTKAELEAYLARHGRDALSLLVASRLADDLALLREAVQTDPGEAMAQLELALRSDNPAEKKAAIEAFRALQPDNPLGNYLGAQAAFAAGDYAKAAQDLLHSMDQGVLRNQSLRLLEATGEAYAEAGYEPTAALIAGLGKSVGVTLEQSRLSVAIKAGLQTMQDEFVKAADFDAVEPTLLVGIDLGQRLQDPKAMMIEQLTGISVESGFLRQLDPVTLVGGVSAGERLTQLEARSAEFMDLTKAMVGFARQAADEDLSRYFEIFRRDGELAAARWAKERVGK